MKKELYENASERKSYVGKVFKKGENLVKKEILAEIDPEWAKLHKEGYIHIHDLDAYGLTYNCLTLNILNKFPYDDFVGLSSQRKIIALFDYYKDIIAKMGNEQSGGMAFANFDVDTAGILLNLNIEETKSSFELIRDCISSFILWCNNAHERMGQVSYYVTLNIGLATSSLAKKICEYVIDEFEKLSWKVFKPNIVYKVKNGINAELLNKALLCTTKKMIPTYLLCDSTPNKSVDAYDLAVMGCRTRVVRNQFGKNSSIGRGNIDNITINLPRLALEVQNEVETNRITSFLKKWEVVAEQVKDILIDRYNKLMQLTKADFPTNLKHDLWCADFSKDNGLEDIFRNGTLSIGFIGLSEAVEVLCGSKFYMDKKGYKLALQIVEYMRGFVDKLREKHNMNFSLLATSGELISGRFEQLDSELFYHKIFEKEFYTNSFHVEVDSRLSAFDKIEKEAPFHTLCNGGSISYVELKEAPLGNSEGLKELIDWAAECGTHYLGFNFDKDICNQCGQQGVFDVCENCGSKEITRIRRVSGYLEILDYFTLGKKAEERNRKKN